ncbi:MAG: hypothetical protein EXS30_08910 [Pedosphaera sp.]|nr:hypothetical protein [Pedosphaera sp.]
MTNNSNQLTPRTTRLSRRRARFYSSAGATLVALLVTEIVLRVFPTAGIYFQMRRVVQQYCTRPNVQTQYSNREDFTGNFATSEFNTAIRINHQGLRDRERPYERPDQGKRVLVLGDSFVFGWGVESDQAVSAQLERQLSSVEAINAGCSGWSTRQEWDFLRVEGIRYRPDLVLLFFCENDPAENDVKYQFLDGSLRLQADTDGIKARLRRLLVKNSALCALAYGAISPLLSRPTGPKVAGKDNSQWQSEAELLRAMGEFCQAARTQLAIVYIPLKGPDRRPQPGPYFARLSAVCARLKIPFLDLAPALLQSSSTAPVYYRLDDHWTAAGHRAAAEATVAFIRSQSLLR